MTWNDYLENTKKYPPRPLLQEALTYLKSKKTALDIGAGALNDTRYLIANNFCVTVVDSNPMTLSLCEGLQQQGACIKCHCVPFNEFTFPEREFDVVNAQYALPFNGEKDFFPVWEGLTRSLHHGGVFTGQFFGNEDEWFGTDGIIFHTREQVEELFADGWDVKKFEEERAVRPTASGEEKRWHIFHVIASRK